jgi:hypothetical protein
MCIHPVAEDLASFRTSMLLLGTCSTTCSLKLAITKIKSGCALATSVRLDWRNMRT